MRIPSVNRQTSPNAIAPSETLEPDAATKRVTEYGSKSATYARDFVNHVGQAK
jgi:hypothetical protein